MQTNTQLLDDKITEILLKDRTTGKNIMWATDNYQKYGERYNPENQITLDLLTLDGESIIKPRVEKSKEEQEIRIKQKAEVFTPAWVCNLQINILDDSWFERKNVFNVEYDEKKTWETVKGKIVFPKGKTWQDYVNLNDLEITCGEAPYIVSRYDAATGEHIDVENRIGMLDRKLRIVGENTDNFEDWLKWATISLQSVYGYEWQGDNIFIARKNLFFSMIEHYEYKFKIDGAASIKKDLPLEFFAEIISWNILQMDGLKFVIPNSCKTKTVVEHTLFGDEVVSTECVGCKKGDYFKHNGIYCKIMDWKENEVVRFVDCGRKPEESDKKDENVKKNKKDKK